MKYMKYLTLFLIMVMFTQLNFNVKVQAENENIQSPYYTYTINSDNQYIRTTEAYTPGIRITEVNGKAFNKLQHVFVDQDKYTYITDSGNKDIYVLDENFNYVATLEHKSITFPKSTYVTEDKIYVVNLRDSNILVFDKEELLTNNKAELLQTIGKPNSPIFEEGYVYKPENIVVDIRGNIYIQSIGSENGLIMLDDDGKFMTFFGGNPYRIPVLDQVRQFFLTEKQEEKMELVFPDTPTNIAIDSKGYVFTVTSSIPTNPIKKFNVRGTNFFNENMVGSTNMISIAIGQYNNVFTITDTSHIFEYDTNGNLLFMFGGNDGSNRVGVLKIPVSIAANSKDQILIADQGSKAIQVYDPTMFTNAVHHAIQSYQDGNYEESLDKWRYVLQYNSLFDYAHIGLGDAYLRDNNYQAAHVEYTYAKDYDGMSDAAWGIRQEWLLDHLFTLIWIVVILILLRIVYAIINYKYQISPIIKEWFSHIRKKNQLFDELVFIFEFLKHPFDGFYAIKRQNRVSLMTSSVIYILLGVVYILNFQFTNSLFVPKHNVNVAYELFVIAFVLVLWVISNYLVCAISDGEGSMKNVYNATAYALSPILVILPLIIITSNFITYQERVFYDLSYTVMIIWTAFLLFFKIKDIHNYEVIETIVIILKSLFTMLIIALCLFIINALGSQMFTIVKEIVTEVIRR